jgi:hypothetical protein
MLLRNENGREKSNSIQHSNLTVVPQSERVSFKEKGCFYRI